MLDRKDSIKKPANDTLWHFADKQINEMIYFKNLIHQHKL